MTAALNSIVAFLLTITYWNVVDITSLPWTIIIHATVGIVGIPYIFYNMPDTENKTLQQIQNDLEKNTVKQEEAEFSQ